MNKPNGQFLIPNDREKVMEFMSTLPVRKVSWCLLVVFDTCLIGSIKVTGVGYVLERQLKALDVNTCGDIYDKAPLLHEVRCPYHRNGGITNNIFSSSAIST